MSFRTLASQLAFRSRLANIAGFTFGGKRDLYRAFGYKRELFPSDYRSRYERNEVAFRIVSAFPEACWRGGAEVIEDESLDRVTSFEQAVIDLDNRLKLWDALRRTDELSGIGRYAILVLMAPGELDQPLERCGQDDLRMLQPYAEEEATIQEWDADKQSPRFGKPRYYTCRRTTGISSTAINSVNISRRVHYSRVLHVSDGLLDDSVYGTPRLRKVWNRLDDLEKVVGGGAEAFFRRADAGTLFDLDATQEFDPEDQKKLQKKIDEFEHGFRRTLLSRGLDMKVQDAQVAEFDKSVASIMSLISTGTGIPQRVLMGSEQGKLAAKQDRASFDNRVTDRQNDYCGPMVARVFFDRLIELGVLPVPKAGYEVEFTSIKTMDDEQRSTIAAEWADLNKPQGPIIVVPDEIRKVLGLPPLKDVAPELIPEPGHDTPSGPPTDPSGKPAAPGAKVARVGARAKGGAPYAHVHEAADRFRPGGKADRLKGLRRRATNARPPEAPDRVGDAG
jgi:hypothetical protein